MKKNIILNMDYDKESKSLRKSKAHAK
jgi:hypothetical protein